MRRSPNFQNFQHHRNNGKGFNNYSWYKSESASMQYNNNNSSGSSNSNSHNHNHNHSHNHNHNHNHSHVKDQNRPQQAQSNYVNYNNYKRSPLPPAIIKQQSPLATNDEVPLARMQKKAKKRSLSTRICKNWVREDAEKALELENEYSKSAMKAPTLLLRFPDPELNRTIVGAYSPEIESVHFQLNAAPRYCFVHLKEGADAEKVIESISKIPFGNGFISAEIRRALPTSSNVSNVDDLDPYTLYVGNLANTVSTRKVKDHFPNGARVDIGFAQRIKGTRYAIVRYESVEKAMEDFKMTVNSMIENRSLVVRFLRKKGLAEASTSSSVTTTKMQKDGDVDVDDLPQSACDNRKNNVKGADNDDGLKPSATSSLKLSFDQAQGSNDAKRMRLSPNVAGRVNADESYDSKENVLAQASRLSSTIPCKTEPGDLMGQQPPWLSSRASTAAAAMHCPFDVDSAAAPSSNMLLANVTIKQEIIDDDGDDNLSEEEVLSDMLGSRYDAAVDNIKRECDDNSTIESGLNNDTGQNSFEYDEDFTESGTEDERWASVTQKLRDERTQQQQSSAKHVPMPNDDSIADMKPSLSELQDRLKQDTSTTVAAVATAVAATTATAHVVAGEHTTFVKKLYEQVKRMKEPEDNSRPRDELDDLFAQMNSDNEDYVDDVF